MARPKTNLSTRHRIAPENIKMYKAQIARGGSKKAKTRKAKTMKRLRGRRN